MIEFDVINSLITKAGTPWAWASKLATLKKQPVINRIIKNFKLLRCQSFMFTRFIMIFSIGRLIVFSVEASKV